MVHDVVEVVAADRLDAAGNTLVFAPPRDNIARPSSVWYRKDAAQKAGNPTSPPPRSISNGGESWWRPVSHRITNLPGLLRVDVFTLVPHAFAAVSEQRPVASVLGGPVPCTPARHSEHFAFEVARGQHVWLEAGRQLVELLRIHLVLDLGEVVLERRATSVLLGVPDLVLTIDAAGPRWLSRSITTKRLPSSWVKSPIALPFASSDPIAATRPS